MGSVRDLVTAGDVTVDDADAPRPAIDELPIVAAETYRIGHEVARGGLGRILEAVDQRMGRKVAIKELLPRRGRDADAEHRFVREAMVTARLEHPSIVPVHEAGRWPSGAPFYAMKLVSGRSLLEIIKATPGFADRLALLPKVIAVAEAIAYAHARRVIHRDIKPANVIVGEFGETVVIDWGLAKDLDAASPPVTDEALTATAPSLDDPTPPPSGVTPRPTGKSSITTPTLAGKVMGTPAYMSPEQARGEAVDERTDVYALGSLLYHVLAGCSPITRADAGDASDPTRTSHSVARRAPVPIEQRQPGLPTDLVTIVHKAMARAPSDRYPTASELAEDLRRFQTGQLVHAHRYTAWALARRWLRRYRALVVVAAVALGLVVGFAAISVSRIVRAREVAESERREAQRRGAEAEGRKNELLLLQAQAALAADPTASLAWLKLYPASAPSWDRARAIALDAHSRGVARHVLGGHRGAIHALAVSPDGRTVASGGTDKTLRLWRPDGGPPTVLDMPGGVGVLAFSPDGRQLVATAERTLMVWTLGDGPPAARVLGMHDDSITGVAFAPDGRTVASVSMDRTVRRWDLATGAARIWRGDTYASWGVAYAPDGATLFTGSEERNLRRWQVATGQSDTVTNPEPFGPIALAPDGQTVALAGESGIHLWSFATRPPTHRALPRQGDYVLDVAFSPDGRQLATGNSGGAVRLWDLATGHARALLGHQGHVISVAYAADGRSLATAGNDATIRIWRLEALGEQGRALDGLGPATSHPVLSPDGRTVAVGGQDAIALWPVTGGAPRLLRGAVGAITTVAFRADGRLVTRGDDGLRVWDASGATPPHTLAAVASAPDMTSVSSRGDVLFLEPGRNAAVVLDGVTGATRCRFAGQNLWTAIFAPDGGQIAYVDRDEIRLGDLAGCASRLLYRHAPGIIVLAFSPDGRYLASGVDDRVGLWDARTQQVAMLDGHTALVSEVAFSPDGTTLASGGVDQTIRLWDVESRAVRRVLTGHDKAVRSLRFVGDGRRLASTALDGTVRLWSLDDDDVRVLRGPDEVINGLAVAPDGRAVVIGTRDHTVLWSLDAGGLPTGARGPAGLGAWLADATTAMIGAHDRVESPVSR